MTTTTDRAIAQAFYEWWGETATWQANHPADTWIEERARAISAAAPAGAQATPVSAETIRNHIAVTMQDWNKVYQTPQFREDLRMAILSMKPLYTHPPAASEDAADAAQLDWLIANPGKLHRSVGERPYYFFAWSPRQFATARAAIDAARDGEGVG